MYGRMYVRTYTVGIVSQRDFVCGNDGGRMQNNCCYHVFKSPSQHGGMSLKE